MTTKDVLKKIRKEVRRDLVRSTNPTNWKYTFGALGLLDCGGKSVTP